MSFVCVYVISCITKCYLFAVIYIIRRIYLSNHIVVIVLRTQQGDIMVNTLYVLVCVRLCCAHENCAWRVQINSIIDVFIQNRYVNYVCIIAPGPISVSYGITAVN